jgi:hypothetical protein
MIYRSDDGLLEVTVSDDPDSTGHFAVSARRLSDEDFWAFIRVDFGGPDNFTRIDYKTQDRATDWRVAGSRRGDRIADVQITITYRVPPRS